MITTPSLIRLRAVSALAFGLALGATSFAKEPAATANQVGVTTGLTPAGAGRIVVEASGVVPVAPLFFTASVEQSVRVSPAEAAGEANVSVRILQGRPEVITLGLTGEGEVSAVSGAGLRDWSVRQGPGAAGRFLDLRPVLVEGAEGPRTLELVVRTRRREPALPGTLAVLLVAPGSAVGFESRITVTPGAAVDLRVTEATGVSPVGDLPGPAQPAVFVAHGEPRLQVALARRGAALAEAELTGVHLAGRLNEAAGSVDFTLRAQARAERAGVRLRVLSGHAALNEKAAGEGWHVEIVRAGKGFAYDLVLDRKGVVPVEFAFAAALRADGDWRRLEFAMPAGAVVPLVLTGLPAGVAFATKAAVVPVATPAGWQGFLPVAGGVELAWRETRETGEGALFFTTTEQTEVRVGAGVARQSAHLAWRILQGKLGSVRLRIAGPGEIVGVEGDNVLAWQVLPAETGRVLAVTLSRPFEGTGAITVQSQAALGEFPVSAEPLRLVPEGGVQHAGFVRVANAGAVRLEVAEVEGLMQLAPEQFPGGAVEDGVRQVFVYRFPAAERSYRVLASQILPEVSVSQVVTYELGETDRVVQADVELEVREAELRAWSLVIPADYGVVAVQGAEVADYAVDGAAEDGGRRLKIIFKQAVQGRLLVRLRLEKNQPAGTGEWRLEALRFPGAKSVRGHIGAVAAPGYRLVPGAVARLAEEPVSLFPRQTAGLQQAYRLRDATWTAALTIEALGQSVQADVFHLYSLKEGVVHGSVLLNYFVVGAPASEWRIEVPATAGNIEVIGQGVRREWRREGDQIVVALLQPVLGAATVLVTFEEPLSARGGVITPGGVRPLGVQAERGYLHVVSPLQVKHAVHRAEGLLRLEPLELPAEFRLLTTSPSLAVYHYTARPFALELGVEGYQPGETVDQVVEFATLASRISRDGQVVTEARFFVKTRGRKSLRLTLPAAMKLWEARVDGEVVNARADGAETLVPLPARLNANEAVEVALRLGQAAGASATRVNLTAPVLSAPLVIGEWSVRGDPGRLLVPGEGTADLTRPNLTERGFTWIAERGQAEAVALLALIVVAALALRARSGGWAAFAVFAGGVAVVMAAGLALEAATWRQVNRAHLNLAATVVPAGGTVSVDVGNVVAWRALLSGWGVAAAVVGIAAAVVGRGRRAPGMRVAGVVLMALGVLLQRGGAVVFFGAVAIAVVFGVVGPALRRSWQAWRQGRETDEGAALGAPSAGPVVPLLALTVLTTALGSLGTSEGRAEARAQSLVQRWEIRDGRLHAEIDVGVRGRPGESVLLLKAPAVLTEFSGDGLRVGKVAGEGGEAYYMMAEREGTLTARAKFELPVPELGKELLLPTGPAAVQRLTVQLDQAGWAFTSPAAVQVSPLAGLAAGRSGATLVLGPEGAPVLRFTPQRRDTGAEATTFFAEGSTVYVPGPGVVNGLTRVSVRPVQGRVSTVELEVPAGFTVGEVNAGPVGTWRFDPSTRRLRVAVEPAQVQAFQFVVEMQRGTEGLPFDLTLAPPRVAGAAGEVGLVALAFGADAQPEGVKPAGLTPVNAQDFDATLLPKRRDGQALATLQHVYRYGAEGGTVTLRVAPVAPEVRVATRQVLSLGDDRLVMAGELDVAITRVGLFKLSFALPAGLEVEALSGEALSHWTEAVEGGQRVVTLHLNGRTLGTRRFAVTLAGQVPAPQENWPVPRLHVREATRQTGELQVVPEKGIRLRAVERTQVSPLDLRATGAPAKPGALAFRLLQQDWALTLGIEALEPWVTVQALQEVTVREGQTLTRLGVRYRVENAAVKHLRVRLPGLGEAQRRTVRATGQAVSDLVPVPGQAGVWDLRFQRGIIGDTEVQIEFQGDDGREPGRLSVATPVFENVRQVTQFVAVRGGGHLELSAGEPPRGWARSDWGAVPAALQDRADRSVPALAFRVAEPEQPLAVTVRRHGVAEALKLRVTSGELLTLLSPAGPSLTAVELNVQVVEKSTLRVRLPEGAQLFNTFVNGQSVTVVRDGEASLFHVAPATETERSAKVRLVYAVPMLQRGGEVTLRGPGLNVPLENVAWRVVVPAGYALSERGGALRLREDRVVGDFGVDDYRALATSKRVAEAKQATDFIEQANTFLRAGRQQQAGEVLSRVSNGSAPDEATNEDARVQLRALKTEQALIGLNTRRQRLYLGNTGADVRRNEQLEQAAGRNPFIQGRTDYDPQQVDQLLSGNTAEENTALLGIAGRIVDQQLAAEPAPTAIDVTLPQRGQVLTFTRSLQVEGGAPLELRLAFARPGGGLGTGLAVLLASGVVGALLVRPRRDAAS